MLNLLLHSLVELLDSNERNIDAINSRTRVCLVHLDILRLVYSVVIDLHWVLDQPAFGKDFGVWIEVILGANIVSASNHPGRTRGQLHLRLQRVLHTLILSNFLAVCLAELVDLSLQSGVDQGSIHKGWAHCDVNRNDGIVALEFAFNINILHVDVRRFVDFDVASHIINARVGMAVVVVTQVPLASLVRHHLDKIRTEKPNSRGRGLFGLTECRFRLHLFLAHDLNLLQLLYNRSGRFQG